MRGQRSPFGPRAQFSCLLRARTKIAVISVNPPSSVITVSSCTPLHQTPPLRSGLSHHCPVIPSPHPPPAPSLSLHASAYCTTLTPLPLLLQGRAKRRAIRRRALALMQQAMRRWATLLQLKQAKRDKINRCCTHTHSHTHHTHTHTQCLSSSTLACLPPIHPYVLRPIHPLCLAPYTPLCLAPLALPSHPRPSSSLLAHPPYLPPPPSEPPRVFLPVLG